MNLLKNRQILILLSILIFTGCNKKQSNQKIKASDEKLVVTFGNHFLTDKEIELLLPADYSAEDSAGLVSSYIEEWVKKKAIVDLAETGVDEFTLQEIDNKVIDYRQDLLINAYNNHLIMNTLNDSISDDEIIEYYEANKNSFPLNKRLLRFRSVTVGKNLESKAEKLFRTNNEKDLNELEELIASDGGVMLDTGEWYTTESLVSHFPGLTDANLLDRLLNRRILKIDLGVDINLIRILELRQKDSEAPLEYVKPTIKNLLLNKRKLNLLHDLQTQLYKDAVNNNQIQIHEH